VQSGINRVNSSREFYCCWLLSCKSNPLLTTFSCACLSSSRRCSQLQHYPVATGPVKGFICRFMVLSLGLRCTIAKQCPSQVTDDKSPQIKVANPSRVHVWVNKVVVEWSHQVNSIAAWCERPLSLNKASLQGF